jgi:SAM-dependent methyltransferase
LPFATDSADVVYNSHFLEHVPRASVPKFLNECRRVLKVGGQLRIVIPDLENICRTYLAERDAGHHERADFVVLELIDQCVRKQSGGELGRYYDEIQTNSDKQSQMAAYVTERTGHVLELPVSDNESPSIRKLGFMARMLPKFRAIRMRAALSLLPPEFRKQNVSLAEVGETHQWMWDFHMLRETLAECGFRNIARFDFKTSGIPNFPVESLDIGLNGGPRKGTASLYVEATKWGA